MTQKTQKHLSVSIRKVIAVSACLLASGQLMAQPGFDFGLKGNIQGSTLINSQDQAAGPEIDFVTKIRAAGGISAGYTFNRHMGVEVNVLYSKQGQDYKGNMTLLSPASMGIFSNNIDLLASANGIAAGNPYTASVALTYIKIPILFRYTGNNCKKMFFSSFIGPQVDLLTAVKYRVNNTDASTSKISMGSTNAYHKTGVDAVLGLGAGFNLPQHLVLSVHLRMDYGLTDAEDKGAKYGGGLSKFYDSHRETTNNATAGFMVSLDYKLVKKVKEKKPKVDEYGNEIKSKKDKDKAKNKEDQDDKEDADDNEDRPQNKKKK